MMPAKSDERHNAQEAHLANLAHSHTMSAVLTEASRTFPSLRKGTILGVVLLALALPLVGCSASAHQVIDASKSCSSCHSEEKQTYEISAENAPASATTVGTTVTVNTSASQVFVCEPTFIAEDGSRFVPVRQSAVSVGSSGSATVTLEEGLWVLATQSGGTDTTKALLVFVDSAQTDGTTVEL